MVQIDVTFAGLKTPTFPVYPLEDHFAEKLHVYTTPREDPSRVKDLVDKLPVPPASWHDPFEALAAELALTNRDIDEAYDRVDEFLSRVPA